VKVSVVYVSALFNLNNGLALAGIGFGAASGGMTTDTAAAPAATGGAQEVSMTVTPYGSYEPSTLTVKAGVPVRWIVDGTNALGCTSILTIPSMRISQALHGGRNIIEFTPTARGTLPFMCSMGMVRGRFNVI
jgi:plastocyanin domain-containing protein